MTDMSTQSTLTTCNYLSVCTWRLTKLKCRRKNSWQKTEPPNLNICYCYCDFAFQKMLFSMRNGIAQHIKHNQLLNLQSKSPRMVPTREWKPNLYPHYWVSPSRKTWIIVSLMFFFFEPLKAGDLIVPKLCVPVLNLVTI